MQITDFTFTNPAFTTIGANLYRFTQDCDICVNLPAGKGYKFTLLKGFVTNFRSGPDIINSVIPKFGDQDLTLSYAVHDALYTRAGSTLKTAKHMATKKFADELLREMLKECDRCTKAQIKQLEMDKKANSLEYREPFNERIKFLKGQILGSVKIWAIFQVVDKFGGKAFNEAEVYPYDENFDKIRMEVL
ncbi:MAG: DUF1353 domain-containing protein [Fibromonadales bacterium]|nr:DUF1353 domain-containing protein [Fibromonadales bacterium]